MNASRTIATIIVAALSYIGTAAAQTETVSWARLSDAQRRTLYGRVQSRMVVLPNGVVRNEAALRGDGYAWITGRIRQAAGGDVYLVETSGGEQDVMLRIPGNATLTDGESVATYATALGVVDFRTVLGANRRVQKYQATTFARPTFEQVDAAVASGMRFSTCIPATAKCQACNGFRRIKPGTKRYATCRTCDGAGRVSAPRWLDVGP